MMNSQSLFWLPPAPKDWRQRLASIDWQSPDGGSLRALASYDLDQGQLSSLARRCQQYHTAFVGRDLSKVPQGLEPLRLGILGSGTLDLIIPLIMASGLRHGLWLEVVSVDYGQGIPALIDPESAFNKAKCQLVLLAFDYRALLPAQGLNCHPDAACKALELLGRLASAARANGAVPVVQSLAPMPESMLGSFDLWREDSLSHAIGQVNAGLQDTVQQSGAVLLDVATLAASIGLDQWHDPATWYMAKLPFSLAAAPRYAESVARLAAATRGKSRRCLVLDLDNTLWGGVLGDDGIDGIRLGQGSAQGEAHLALQAYALALRDCGVVLAISSKNDDALVRRALAEHPEMLLRESHFAAIQANWVDKASNLEAIAESLSLGLGSLVFVDDNPAERELIRQKLPAVAVPELPDDAAFYVRTLAAGGYFETLSLSNEDRARAAYYEGNARRRALQSNQSDLDDYLAGLEMKIEFSAFKAVDRARIAQLVAKSNQFNLTTRRYTEAEIEAMERDPDVISLQVRLSDIFGDNGLISVLIARRLSADTLEIDTWLMSCRVLGRRVEEAVLRELIRRSRSLGISRLRGEYRPTERNGIVKDHYARLGFAQECLRNGQKELWVRDTVPLEKDLPFEVSSDFI